MSCAASRRSIHSPLPPSGHWIAIHWWGIRSKSYFIVARARKKEVAHEVSIRAPLRSAGGLYIRWTYFQLKYHCKPAFLRKVLDKSGLYLCRLTRQCYFPGFLCWGSFTNLATFLDHLRTATQEERDDDAHTANGGSQQVGIIKCHHRSLALHL